MTQIEAIRRHVICQKTLLALNALSLSIILHVNKLKECVISQ